MSKNDDFEIDQYLFNSNNFLIVGALFTFWNYVQLWRFVHYKNYRTTRK
jgi:hypothetical protein